MDSEHIVAFNLALAVALISPGPAFVMSIQTTLSSGRKSGVHFGIGLGLMAAVWTALALLGLEAVFLVFPWAYGLVKTMGALYLLYIAVKIWKNSVQSLTAGSNQNLSRSFVRGVLVNALNPKSVLFAAAVLVIVFPPKLLFKENVFIVLNHFVVEVIFYSIFAYVMSRQNIREKYIGLKKYLDRISSVVIGGFGLNLLCERYASS